MLTARVYPPRIGISAKLSYTPKYINRLYRLLYPNMLLRFHRESRVARHQQRQVIQPSVCLRKLTGTSTSHADGSKRVRMLRFSDARRACALVAARVPGSMGREMKTLVKYRQHQHINMTDRPSF